MLLSRNYISVLQCAGGKGKAVSIFRLFPLDKEQFYLRTCSGQKIIIIVVLSGLVYTI